MVSRLFICPMSPIRAKLASHELFETMYATLVLVSDYLIDIDFYLFQSSPLLVGLPNWAYRKI